MNPGFGLSSELRHSPTGDLAIICDESSYRVADEMELAIEWACHMPMLTALPYDVRRLRGDE